MVLFSFWKGPGWRERESWEMLLGDLFKIFGGFGRDSRHFM